MKILKLIGWTEIALGATTLAATAVSLFLRTNAKSPNVLIFVICAASVSILLGMGILKLNRTAYLLLLYFASVILLSKTLIFLDIIQLNGALETAIPQGIKNWISLIYHTVVCIYLLLPKTQEIFYHK